MGGAKVVIMEILDDGDIDQRWIGQVVEFDVPGSIHRHGKRTGSHVGHPLVPTFYIHTRSVFWMQHVSVE